jgi:tetratricopeptide (TPR) repeat protein
MGCMALSGRRSLFFALALAGLPAAAQDPAPAFATLVKQADAARDAHQLEKAIDLYQRAIKLRPAWEEGWWNLGSIAYDLDRFDECAAAFRRLSTLQPNGAPVWTMLGLCEFNLRNYGPAVEALTHVEEMGFQENAALSNAARLRMALALTKTGSFEKAIALLTELTRVDKKTPEIVVAAGIAGLRRPWTPGEVPESERELVYTLGDAMASAMELDYKTAVQKFLQLIQAHPSDPNVHYRYGALLYNQDADQGFDEIRKAVELAPNYVPALVSLSVISLKREDQRAAVEYGEKAVEASPVDFSTHLVLGRALLAAGETGRAAGELQQAVKLAPASPEARFSLGTAYTRLGRKEDAAREQAEFKRLQQRKPN